MSIFSADLRIGSIVHYVMAPADYGTGASRSGPQYRPAIVLDLAAAKEPQATIGIVVLLAGAEDGIPAVPPPPAPQCNCPAPCTLWRPAVMQSGDHIPGTWHFPE
jgi:hypothetical protein